MGEVFWQDLTDFIVAGVEAALGEEAYPDDPLAVQRVFDRLIIEPNDWSDDPDQYPMPAVHVFSVRAEPAIAEQMKLGGIANDGTLSLDIIYPYYLVGTVKGTLDSTAHDARILGKRLLDYARGLPAELGSLPPDDTGQRTRQVTLGQQVIQPWAVPTATRDLGYFATVTQPVRVGSYIP